jgi:hypothetical protein
VTLYHPLLLVDDDDNAWVLSSFDSDDFVSIWSSNRIPLSNGGGWGNFVWISFDDWSRTVCNVGKLFCRFRGKSVSIGWFCPWVVSPDDISRLFCFGNVLNVEGVFSW